MPPGTEFQSREALHDAGVHMPPEVEASGSASEGADSFVISGGYADDEDYGDYIIAREIFEGLQAIPALAETDALREQATALSS